MATSGYSHGYYWKYSTPVNDTMAQAASAGITAYGIGDDSHWQGCGDHVSKPCTGHPGWITAVDLMARSGVFDPIDFVMNFLLPALKAGFFPEIQYLLTNYGLWDRKYGWSKQSGGDGPDHAHISHTNAFSLRATYLTKYQNWKKAGRPAVVAWLRSGSTPEVTEMRSALSAVTIPDGRTVTALVGSDNYVYIDIDGAGFHKVDTGTQKFDPGVSASPDGKAGLYLGLIESHKSPFVVHVPDVSLRKASQLPVKALPGTLQGPPAVALTKDGQLVVTGVGTDSKHNLVRCTAVAVDGTPSFSPWRTFPGTGAV